MKISIIPQKAYPSIFTPQTVMQYLKLDGTEDSNIIDMITDYAVSYAQRMTNNLVSQDVYSVSMSEIEGNTIALALYPIISINSVTINNSLLIPGTDYVTKGNIITLTKNTNECIISLTGGFSTLNALSPELRMAILMHISAAYDNRSGSYQAVPFSVNNIYSKIAKLRISLSNTQ